jgi:hypothetical protein
MMQTPSNESLHLTLKLITYVRVGAQVLGELPLKYLRSE